VEHALFEEIKATAAIADALEHLYIGWCAVKGLLAQRGSVLVMPNRRARSSSPQPERLALWRACSVPPWSETGLSTTLPHAPAGLALSVALASPQE